MAEVLLFLLDQPDHPRLPQRGDVITVQEDGWTWGKAELNHPKFRLLRLPGVKVSDLASLLSPEPATEPHLNPSELPNILQYRGFRLDLADDAQPSSLEAVLQARMKKAPIANPAVIGSARSVL